MKFKFLDQRKRDSVKITHIFRHHTKTCTPCKNQIEVARTRTAGAYCPMLR